MAKRHHERPRDDLAMLRKKSDVHVMSDRTNRIRQLLIAIAKYMIETRTGDEKSLRTEAFHLAHMMGINPHELQHAVPAALVLAHRVSIHDELMKMLHLREIIVSKDHDLAVIPLEPQADKEPRILDFESERSAFCLLVTYRDKIVNALPWTGNSVSAIVDGLVEKDKQHRIPFLRRPQPG